MPRGRRWQYLHAGPGHGAQEDHQGHQCARQDAVLHLPEAEQEGHAQGQQIQPWGEGCAEASSGRCQVWGGSRRRGDPTPLQGLKALSGPEDLEKAA